MKNDKYKLWTWKTIFLFTFGILFCLWTVAATIHRNALDSASDYGVTPHNCPDWDRYVPFLVNHQRNN